MKQSLRTIGSSVLLAALTATVISTSAQANDQRRSNGHERTYKVEITNVTKGTQFTPILAAVHTHKARFFSLGDAPSEGLAKIAEGGDTSDLQSALEGSDQVYSAETFVFSDDLPLTVAGTTIEFNVTGKRRFRYLSIASMILPTNDSFIALDTVPLPTWGSRTYYALGYDAGSEVNDELCASIPGPTCGGDGEFTAINGEGFVHIASGIQGHADLDAKVYDWRNPVAKVVITRMR
ncbi:MAG: spondin domain-containing protein [Granulosicoccus sp.]|nr:spondin domain-containing protein [Granulosicoccus sp.]